MYITTWHTVLVIIIISCVTVVADLPRDTWLTLAALSLSLGVAAVASMGTAALLGGRLKLVESAYGGLDHVYQTHNWLGIWALAFASFHFVFQASLNAWDVEPILSMPRPYTRLVRQLSLIALMLIIVLALNRKIPYHVWRLWHKLSGPLFLIVILHWLSFPSPIAISSPAGIWLAAVSILGVAAAAYKLLFYPFAANHAEYVITSVSPGAGALHLELEPVKEAIHVEPGQFGFISMKEDGLREPHPFTIASTSQPGERVHFVIRALGDFTRNLLAKTHAGMHADIYGPYGRFTRLLASKREIWIAGGVGISPFIAWLTDPSAKDFEKVTLFYFFTPGREFPSAEIIEKLARERGASFVANSTGPSDPEFAEQISRIARHAGPANVDVSFCGPKGLLEKIHALMRDNAIPPSGLRYEYFEFR